MISIEDVHSALTTDRGSFSTVFEKAQTNANIDSKIAFEALAVGKTDSEAYKIALDRSFSEGFFSELAGLIIEQGQENGMLFRKMLEKQHHAESSNAPLESMLNKMAGFTQPLEAARGLSKGMRVTAKVLIDGDSSGSGVLISADLILTSWHVVRSLFQQVGDNWEVMKESACRLKVEFDDFSEVINNNNSVSANKRSVYDVHEDWCLAFSHCHSDEINDQLPADLEELNGFWDYAVIRLNGAPGYERDWEKIEKPPLVPKPQEKLFLFQHPAGQSMKFDSDLIITPNPAYPNAIPGLRFVHSVNSLNGSSGGPCFNSSFKLFGIHQGTYMINGAVALNRGVPLGPIVEHISNMGHDLLNLSGAIKPLWHIPSAARFTPVIGCDNFVQQIFRLIDKVKSVILIITGHKALGKSFRIEVLKAVMPSASNIALVIDGPLISKKNPLSLAVHIAESVGQEDPKFSLLEDINSTPSAWIKDFLIPELISIFQKKRNGKNIWLIVKDLNKTEIEDELTSAFLFALYEQVLFNDWLKIVLDGLKTELPDALHGNVEYHKVSEADHLQIHQFFSRIATDTNKFNDAGIISYQADIAYSRYQEALDRDPENAFTSLKDIIKTLLNTRP